MSTLVNSFSLPDGAHTGYNNQNENPGSTSGDYREHMFCTAEGLLGVYVKNDVNGTIRRRVSLYSPGFGGGAQSPFVEFTTAASWAAGYSFTHKAMIGIPFGNGTGVTQLRKMDLKSGAETVIGSVNLGAAPNGVNDNNSNLCAGIAFDGTYLHYLRADTGVVYVVDALGTGNVVRSYGAPFGAATNSICFDQNSVGAAMFMYFGGGANDNIGSYPINHVARVAVGGSNPTTEGTVIGVWGFPVFNVAGQTALYHKQTIIGWDGHQVCVNRKSDTTIYRYDLSNSPAIIIVSPNPARIAINGSTARVSVRVVDDAGNPVVGAPVALSLNTQEHLGTTTVIPILSTYTDGTGYAVSSSTELITGISQQYATWKAFDGTTLGIFATASGDVANSWIKVQLPTAMSLGALAITHRTDYVENLTEPNTFSVQASNDNSSWTTLGTISNQTGWYDGERRYWTFTNTAQYLYYRLLIASNNGSSVVVIGELEFFQYFPADSGASSFGTIQAPTTVNTDSTGTASFTYVSGSTQGTDYIQATVSY